MPMAMAASSASLDAFYCPRISMAEPILSINQPASKGLISPSPSCFRPPGTAGLMSAQTLADRGNPGNKSTAESPHSIYAMPPPPPPPPPPPQSTNSTASSSLTSGSCPQVHSGSEEEQQQQQQQEAIDQRKQKRMISNRESARRSRMRKQQHLDDLRAQIVQLRAENNHLLNKFNLASQHYLQIEGENRALRSHAMDLYHKLQSLNIALQQQTGGGLQSFELGSEFLEMNPCYLPHPGSQSMAAAEIPQ